MAPGAAVPAALAGPHAAALRALQGRAADRALDAYFRGLLDEFPGFALERPGTGLLDLKVTAAIDATAGHLHSFRAIVNAIAGQDRAVAQVDALARFFSQALAFKRVSGDAAPVCHLWVDGYRFLLREWFLTALTVLLRAQRYAAADLLLNHRFRAPAGGEESFVAFDSHVKSLDEFRARRLRVSRVSLSADLLRQRVDESLTPLQDIMQCDFLLCLRSLLHADDELVRWYPRTLVFGDASARQGFDLLRASADPAGFAPVATLLRVRDRDELVDRFEDVAARFGLGRWAFGGVAVDFRGFLGWRSAGPRD